jgi:hypothetical protein
MGWDSSFSKTTGYRMNERDLIPRGAGLSHFVSVYGLNLEPSQPAIQWVPGAL